MEGLSATDCHFTTPKNLRNAGPIALSNYFGPCTRYLLLIFGSKTTILTVVAIIVVLYSVRDEKKQLDSGDMTDYVVY